MNGNRSTPVEPTRRQLLATLGTTTTAVLAGCGGDGGADSPSSEGGTSGGDQSGSDPSGGDPSGSNDQSADVPWENDDGDTGGGGGCPSTPMSYTSREWPDEEPYVSFDIPQADGVQTEVSYIGLRIIFADGPREINVWGAEGRSEQGYSESTVDERVENESMDELTEEYDVGSGVRVFCTYGALEAVPAVTTVYLPSGSGSLQVDIRIGGGGSELQCQEAVSAAHRNLVETMRTV